MAGTGVEAGTDRIIWEPQPKQRLALECPVYEMFYGGAKGGGKSDFLLADFLQHAELYKSASRGVIFRRTYPELEELQRRAREIYPPLGAEYHKQERMWEFPDGGTLRFRYLKTNDDVHSYQGHQYSWIGFDELTNWASDYCYIYMHSCARSAEGANVQVRASGNPGSVGHLWVKTRFIDVAPPMTVFKDPVTGLGRVFIPARLEDNKKLEENDPEYRNRLLMQPEHLRRAYLYGDWDIFAGQVFEEFRREKHVVRPFSLDPNWFRFASMDWGHNTPFSIGWHCVTGDGRKIRYRDWYGCEPDRPNTGIKMPASEVAERSFRMSVAEGCVDMVADPSCWSKTKADDKSVAEIFESVGWRMHKANNDRKNGLQKLHDMLMTTGHDGRPMCLYFDTCYDFIRLLPVQTYSERDPEDVDTNGEDHIYDEERYAVMSDFVRPVTIDVSRVVDDTVDEL